MSETKPCPWEKPGTCLSVGVAFYCKLEEHAEDTPHSEEVLGPEGKTRGAWADVRAIGGRTRYDWATMDPIEGVRPADFAALLAAAFGGDR